MLRTNLWVTLSLAAIIIVAVDCSPPPPVEPESLRAARPSYDSYYLAAPTGSLPELPRGVSLGLRNIIPLDLEFEIGKNGRVRRITATDSVLPAGWDDLIVTLKRMQFYPGRVGDRPVNQNLPATLILGPKKYQRKIIFPVDSSGQVSDPDLYWRGMMLNSIELPSLERFPSYFLDIDLKDTSTDLNYLLVRVDLDNAGRVISYEKLHSGARQFTDQILAAVNWADYTVPFSDTDSSRSVYLRIALYNHVPYPTIKLEFPVDSLPLPERERVKLFPDTVGLMFKPIPTRYQSDGIYSLLGGRLANADTMYVLISIGASGLVTSFNPVGSGVVLRNKYLKLARWLRFYPARDFSGKARSFSGIARLEYQGSTKIRIRFLWLPGEGGSY